MPRYMLDTDISSCIMNREGSRTIRKLQEHEVSDICVSSITRSELAYGIEVSPRRAKDENALRIFLRHIAVLDYPSDAAPHYAQIRAFLKTRGKIIGANDLLIAAHARCLGIILVTSNTREFSRIPDLKIENWS